MKITDILPGATLQRCATLIALKQVERRDRKQWRALESLDPIQVIGSSGRVLEAQKDGADPALGWHFRKLISTSTAPSAA